MGGSRAEGRKTLRVLVVDDNRDSAESLALLLRLQGREARTAHSGPAALEAAREWRPDVVLCDLGLPEMDGLTVARTLRRDPATASLYLIAVSGYGSESDQQRALEGRAKQP